MRRPRDCYFSAVIDSRCSSISDYREFTVSTGGRNSVWMCVRIHICVRVRGLVCSECTCKPIVSVCMCSVRVCDLSLPVSHVVTVTSAAYVIIHTTTHNAL